MSPSWIQILKDQMGRAYKGQPSIFGIGITLIPLLHPFVTKFAGEQNLIWKNLSSQEIWVIFRSLKTSQYDQVLLIYYQTYRLAIEVCIFPFFFVVLF